MKIDLTKINQEDFTVSERGDFYLINPRHSKWKWNDNELWYRSLLTRKDGTVVSSGFPKFFNYGEYAPHTKRVKESLKSNIDFICYTEKMDGSLIIRDVIDDMPHFRTRGSHELGEFEKPVMELIKEKYPILLGNIFGRGYSLLMEFVSPTNQIVLRYEEPELYILGAAYFIHKFELLASKNHVESLARIFEVPPVPMRCMTPKSSDDLVAAIYKEQGTEGIVVRIEDPDGEITLCKMKSETYLMMHRLKSDMNENSIKQLIWLNKDKLNIDNDGFLIVEDSFEKMKTVLYEKGLDYEIISQFEYLIRANLELLAEIQGNAYKMFTHLTYIYDVTERKRQLEIIRETIQKLGFDEKSYFSLGIAILDKRADEWIGSTFLDMGIKQYQQFMKKVGADE